jgi:hypothetical protein
MTEIPVTVTMEAATEKDAGLIERARNLSHTDKIWCDEYEKMISGMLLVLQRHFRKYELTNSKGTIHKVVTWQQDDISCVNSSRSTTTIFLPIQQASH